MPNVWQLSSQRAPLTRPPWRTWLSTSEPPNSTLVPGCQSTPGEGVAPGTPVVIRAGNWLSLIHHSKYSPLTQKQLGGPQAQSALAHGTPQSGPGALSKTALGYGADSTLSGEGGDCGWLTDTEVGRGARDMEKSSAPRAKPGRAARASIVVHNRFRMGFLSRI